MIIKWMDSVNYMAMCLYNWAESEANKGKRIIKKGIARLVDFGMYAALMIGAGMLIGQGIVKVMEIFQKKG